MVDFAKTENTNMGKNIELVNISDLTPYEKNTRIHRKYQIDQIKESIKEFGFTNPLLVTRDNTLIAGHGRLMAAKELHFEQVPVIRLDYLTPEQARAYVIADNKIAENSEWDMQLLSEELKALDDLDFDVSLLGFSDEDLDKLLDEDDEDESEGGLGSEPEQPGRALIPVTQPGDMWILGDHKLICGSPVELESYHRLFKGEKVDQVITDLERAIKVNQDDVSEDAYMLFNDVLSIIDTADDNTFYLFIDDKHAHLLRQALDTCEVTFADYLILLRKQRGSAKRDYRKKHQLILYGWKHSHSFYGGKTSSTVFEDGSENNTDLQAKPLEVIKEIIGDGSKRNGLVYDPFAGSGTTLIACEKKGRRCFSMELDPKYCDVAIKRWQESSRLEAYLESTGTTFNELI